jgi:2-oxoisovalerate dehydrogenase E2 component (dihydrolipoyl transacylase)
VAKVTMPQLGESVAEGTIGKWLKQPGDHVAKYEPLLEVITDKVNAEVPSPVEGILKEILVEEGATVPNNAEIAVIEEAGAAGEAEPEKTEAEKTPEPTKAAEPATAAEPAKAAEPARGPAGSDERPERPEEPAASRPAAAATAAVSAPTATGTGGNGRGAAEATQPGDADARMTPAVRRLLREHGLTAAQIVGTGGGGRITREDVLDFVEAGRTGQAVGGQAAPSAIPATSPTPSPTPSTPAAPAPGSTPAPSPAPAVTFKEGEDEQLVPWTQMRKGVANAMVRSTTTVPHAYTSVEADVTGLVRLREAHKAEYQAREGLSLSFVPFIIKAVVEALRKHPKINAHWTEDGLLVKRRVGVAVAVAVDDGLITPVIHDADQLSIAGLNRAVLDVAGRARANRLQLADLQGGTITVNNTGWFGSVASQSIVNTPQVVIVNMEAIVKRPVVRESPEGDVIAIRSIMNVPVAFDHRATDGAQVGRFVADIKAWLESIGPDTPIY